MGGQVPLDGACLDVPVVGSCGVCVSGNTSQDTVVNTSQAHHSKASLPPTFTSLPAWRQQLCTVFIAFVVACNLVFSSVMT